ncbi:MAG: Uma2 family endonuclease [Pyrinomonadaceae bacterium]
MTTQIRPLLTIADLEALPESDEQYELINGDLLVSRAPHIAHQFAISNLLYALKEYLSRNPIGRVVPEPGVVLSENDSVRPDIAYLTNERFMEILSGGKLYGAPDLVVEILSAGAENERRDRNIKRRLYGKYGVREYWIVDWRASHVEVHRLSESGLELIETLSGEDKLTSPLLPDFSYKVAGIFDV